MFKLAVLAISLLALNTSPAPNNSLDLDVITTETFTNNSLVIKGWYSGEKYSVSATRGNYTTWFVYDGTESFVKYSKDNCMTKDSVTEPRWSKANALWANEDLGQTVEIQDQKIKQVTTDQLKITATYPKNIKLRTFKVC